MLKTCLNCGKQFNARISRRKFCSHKCANAFHGKGKKGKVPPHLISYIESRRKPKVTITCQYCGKSFEVSPSGSSRKFCSHECYWKWMEGRVRWSEEEIEKLKELYSNTSTTEVARFLGRTVRSVYRMASLLKLKKSKEYLSKLAKPLGEKMAKAKGYRLWTEEEIEKLRRFYSTSTKEQLLAMFPDRPYYSITSKARSLGLRKEIEYRLGNRNWERGVLVGESLAEDFFSSNGWNIVKKGGPGDAYDFVVERDGNVFVVNVKYGRHISEREDNLKRLFIESGMPALLFITPEKEVFLLPIKKLA
jgi:endogenous inhibitor of DNA gyrase (YacG/DUF329 family)